MQRQQLTSRITHVEPDGVWSNGQKEFNKYRVSFSNGDALGFLAVGNFKGQVGQDLTYEKNEQYNTGKIIRENNFQPNTQTSRPTQSTKEDVQTYIIRQSMLKASVDFHAGKNVSEESIISTARNFINFVNNG